MTPHELSLRLKFHEEQANRLLQQNPLVAEFFHHLTQVELMKQQLQAQQEPNSEFATTETVVN
jgi:hypothetical protein